MWINKIVRNKKGNSTIGTESSEEEKRVPQVPKLVSEVQSKGNKNEGWTKVANKKKMKP